MTIHSHTLGCKLNQLEGEGLLGAFLRAGWTHSADHAPAHLHIVNTCTVTSRADQKARRLVRRLLREEPESSVLVTGCYAQLDADVIAALAAPQDRRRLFIVPLDKKDRILGLPDWLESRSCGPAELAHQLAEWVCTISSSAGDGPFAFDVNSFALHSRASLKIQDGCDNRCSYCRVTLARGPSVSLPAALALARLRELEQRGYAEAVLTGINLTSYNDPETGRGFPALLRELLAGTDSIALRISSIEPEAVDEDFASAIAHPRIRPHFHLSVQSGSDAILRSMRRRYSVETVERAISLLRSVRQDPFLACDIIAGFPGERDVDFSATQSLCEKADFAWIHAFTFSLRDGTDAMLLPGRVSDTVAAQRVYQLLSLGRAGRSRYVHRWQGREVDAVLERSGDSSEGLSVLTENYLSLRIAQQASGLLPGDRVRCRIGLAPPPATASVDETGEMGLGSFDGVCEILSR